MEAVGGFEKDSNWTNCPKNVFFKIYLFISNNGSKANTGLSTENRTINSFIAIVRKIKTGWIECTTNIYQIHGLNLYCCIFFTQTATLKTEIKDLEEKTLSSPHWAFFIFNINIHQIYSFISKHINCPDSAGNDKIASIASM